MAFVVLSLLVFLLFLCVSTLLSLLSILSLLSFCVSIHLPYNAKQASCRRSYFSSVRGGPLKVVVLAVVVLEEVVLEEVVRSLHS